MPARLIYSPKAYVYTKAQNGVVYNLSNYITAGEIQRKVNQVSTASITLRNPQKVFTGGNGQDRAFHPMDPITIYLERLSGYPVRVFTGYLDTTPYLQLYPGTIQLQASCTLKRLLYTYFDPSLPYVIAFFEKYGWINTGQGSIISSGAFQSSGATQAQVMNGQKPFTDLQDGSLGKLLWAILYDIGQWQDSNIYIENLPTGAGGIASRMQALMQSIDSSEQQAANDFTSFLESVIGAGSQGSAGPTGSGTASGPVAGGQQIVQTVEPIATQYNVPLQMVLAVMYIETGFHNQDTAGNPHYGWFQVQTANAPYAYGTWSSSPPTVTQAHDLGLSATAFCSAAAGWAAHDPSLRGNFQDWAMKTQGVTGQNNPLYVTEWSTALQQADSLISQFGNSAAGGGTPSSTTTQSGATAPTTSAGRGDPGGTSNAGTGSTAGAQSGGASGIALQALQRQQQGHMFHYQQKRPIQYGILTDSPVYIDCSGFVIACYKAAGWGDPSHNNYNGSGYTGDMIPNCKKLSDVSQAQPGDICFFGGSESSTEHVNIYVGNGQSISMGAEGDPSIGPAEQMGPSGFLGYYRPDTAGQPGATAATGGATGAVSDNSSAQAFVAELDLPSIEDQITAIALGAEHKGLMHDQSLMPFVQQVAQSALRSFQSLPDGSFYAFYPDYFGEMGHHKPYWYIHDIEILSGGINLTDDALATHVFAVGDNTWPVNNELLNMLFSAGAINIFNAFVSTGIIDTSATSAAKTNATKKNKTTSAKSTKSKTTKNNGGLDPGVMNADEAVKFIQRYGARPMVQDYPMVRSPIFEMLLAYQQFMFAWSNQFKTPFTFTFMPELFPGGKVAFPEHGIQMYVNSVTHSWSYEEGGFTTQSELSAPGLMDGVTSQDFPDLPPYMVQALVEPLRLPASTLSSGNDSLSQVAGNVVQTVANEIQQFGASAFGASPISTQHNPDPLTVKSRTPFH